MFIIEACTDALTLLFTLQVVNECFFQQNRILTKQRNSLVPKISDRLLRVRLNNEENLDYSDGFKKMEFFEKAFYLCSVTNIQTHFYFGFNYINLLSKMHMMTLLS